MFQAMTWEALEHRRWIFLQVTTGTTTHSGSLRIWTCLTLQIAFVMLGAPCRSTNLLFGLDVQVSL